MIITAIMPVMVINDELYQLTRNALQSLMGINELIMVDNASTIGSDQFLGVSTTYIRNRVNLGYPRAVNQGLKLANGDHILVANNDIIASPNWRDVTEDVFSRVDNIGSLHFRMIGYEDTFDYGDKVWATGKERWCTGSFFVWNKKAIDEIGGMDENYGFGGYDDWDWHHRMNHIKKWRSVYTNGAVYKHKDSSTLKVTKEKKWNPDNREYFKKKHGKYPEDIWNEKYPDQMKQPYKPFP